VEQRSYKGHTPRRRPGSFREAVEAFGAKD
jgi:hypothetical protein